jgi:hypothetical protein
MDYFMSGKTYGSAPTVFEWKYILVMAALFLANHAFSYSQNNPKHSKKQNLVTLMFIPYARIVPMHFVILVGAAVPGVLLFFLFLKTIADGVMHVLEHYLFWKSAESSQGQGRTLEKGEGVQ